MAFEQNPIPKDLRPINIARTIAEEPRILAATSTGRNADVFLPNSVLEVGGSPNSATQYYPAPVPDAGFVGIVGNGNAAPGIAQWCSRVLMPVGNPIANPSVGINHSSNLVNRVGCNNAVDHASSAMATGLNGASNLGNGFAGNFVDQTCNATATGLGFCPTTSRTGYPGLAHRPAGNGVHQAIDEGGDDSLSGRKVKFLCSFGGKIMPRPSDGMLRYVGGQTRIISIKRDLSFNELMLKMVETYGQPVVIKYQLPDEELDALVSVSCHDDLENMMDEYEKLIQRSPDGSAKLRLFLFSTSELDPSGLVQFADLHDSKRQYFDAVNGIIDGIGSGITRKESTASVNSTLNSDFSSAEAVDTTVPVQVDINGATSSCMLSPRENAASQENIEKLVVSDSRSSALSDASTFSLGIPAASCGIGRTSPSQSEVDLERSVPPSMSQQQAALDIPPHVSFLHPFIDLHQEVVNHGDYVQLPPQMGFPNAPLLANSGSAFAQQQFHASAAGLTPHQFIPAVQMSVPPPSSLVSVSPNMVQPLMQLQPNRFDQYADQSMGPRIVQLPADRSYPTYQVQVPAAMVGGGPGGYVWQQIPPAEHMAFPDGQIPYQQVIVPDKVQRFKDCYMCQKALPHAHSDTSVQGQQESDMSPVSDSNPTYHSLHLDDSSRTQAISRVIGNTAMGESVVEQEIRAGHRIIGNMDSQVGVPRADTAGIPYNLEPQPKGERIYVQNLDGFDCTRSSVAQDVKGIQGNVQSPYLGFTGTVSRPCEDDAVQHMLPPESWVKQDKLVNKPVNGDIPPVCGATVQTSEHMLRESPKNYSNKLPGIVSNEDTTVNCFIGDRLRPTEKKMEGLTIHHTEVHVNNEHGKAPIGKPLGGNNFDNRPQPIPGQDVLLDSNFGRSKVGFDENQILMAETLPCSSAAVLYGHHSRAMDSNKVEQSPLWVNPGPYAQPIMANHTLDLNHANLSSSGVDQNDKTPCWMDDMARFHNLATSDAELAPSCGDTASLSSPLGQAMAVQGNSNSLFSNQDPWSLHHDGYFPPPRPNKIPPKKEAFVSTVGENRLGEHGKENLEMQFTDDFCQPMINSKQDLGSEHFGSAKGSAEEQMKQELEAVAEAVAASVLHSAMPSNNDMHDRNQDIRDGDIENSFLDKDHKAKVQAVNTRQTEVASLGFPVSDGIGRLQIIKNIDLEELRELGSGTFGTVYHGKWRGTDVAIKRINDRCFAGKPSEQERMRDDFWNEAIKLADLHHPNVVAFYGVVLDGPGGSVATVTEYMVNGSLRNALQKNERSLDKRKRLLIAMDVGFGMEYLHGKNIVHFDLKSDNLLVNLRDPHRPICKVGDLGLSKVKRQTLISGGVRGTLPWMAPELLNGSSSLVSEKVDVFSFGIVMWELLTGEEPYADLHYGAIIGGIVSNTLRPAIPETCDPEWRLLMERCWSSEPSERPSFTEIANELRTIASKIPPKGQN